jgi:hypothetical protein
MKGFKLNEVCTTQKGTRYIGTYEHTQYDQIYDMMVTSYEGISLMPKEYISKEVVVSEKKLFLGGYQVLDYADWVGQFSSLSNEIPRLFYISRFDKNRGRYTFECGLDLLDDGRAWEGITRKTYDSIADALRFIREEVGDDFYILLEEPMRL